MHVPYLKLIQFGWESMHFLKGMVLNSEILVDLASQFFHVDSLPSLFRIPCCTWDGASAANECFHRLAGTEMHSGFRLRIDSAMSTDS